MRETYAKAGLLQSKPATGYLYLTSKRYIEFRKNALRILRSKK